MTREPGFYWARRSGRWLAAHFESGTWFLTDGSRAYEAHERAAFQEIGPRIYPPDHVGPECLTSTVASRDPFSRKADA